MSFEFSTPKIDIVEICSKAILTTFCEFSSLGIYANYYIEIEIETSIAKINLLVALKIIIINRLKATYTVK